MIINKKQLKRFTVDNGGKRLSQEFVIKLDARLKKIVLEALKLHSNKKTLKDLI